MFKNGSGPKKLTLTKETLRILDTRQLGQVQGAASLDPGCTETGGPTSDTQPSRGDACLTDGACTADCVDSQNFCTA